MLAPDNRVIMISGANRGIGHAVAEKLYDAGYNLSLGTRSPEKFANELNSWAPERLLLGHYDAEKKETHRQWVAETVERFGRLDGLVNNAGIMEDFSVEDGDDEALDRMWAVNATDMTTSVETMALDQMTEPQDLAEIVATLLALSNKASIAELIINCRDDVMM